LITSIIVPLPWLSGDFGEGSGAGGFSVQPAAMIIAVSRISKMTSFLMFSTLILSLCVCSSDYYKDCKNRGFFFDEMASKCKKSIRYT
jgi:hypothetical protein